MSGTTPGEDASQGDDAGVAPRFDPVIHEPMRLRICGMLATMAGMRFGDVRDALGISDAMCSRHLHALADRGYVELERHCGGVGGHPVVWARLTPVGRTAFHEHVLALERIVSGHGSAGDRRVIRDAGGVPGGGRPPTAETTRG